MSDQQARGIGVNGSANAIGDGNVINNTVHQYASAPPVVSSLHQLPSPPAGFVGREGELSELRKRATSDSVTILGLVGMGGVGKTSLALRLANELRDMYPDAGLYLDLKGVELEPVSVSAALKHFIRAFEPQAQLPDDEAQLQGIYRTVLNGKRAIVLLDNAKDQTQVAPLLPPHSCAAIVTSRRYFTVSGLVPQNLDTLSPEDACELLLKTAPRIGELAGEMAHRLGYLPLALRLASGAMAAKRNLTAEEYLRRLSDVQNRLAFVKASLQLSYDLLDSNLQLFWRMLSVFSNSFDEMAAAAVWKTDVDAAVDTLGDLITLSMVDFNEATQRYRLHDLARDFASIQISDSERFRAGKLHSIHYWNVLSQANSLFSKGRGDMMLGLELFEKERSNIEEGQFWSAIHANQDEAVAFVSMDYPSSASSILSSIMPPRQQIIWLEASLVAARQLKRRKVEGNLLGSLGVASLALGESERAIEYYNQHLLIAREIGDQRGEVGALSNCGIVYQHLGNAKLAIEYHERALAIAREIGARRSEGRVLGSLGNAYSDLGETKRAIDYHNRHLAIAQEIGDRRGEGSSLGNLGIAYEELGETVLALKCYEQSLKIAREIGDRNGEGNGLWSMSLLRHEFGDLELAKELASQALHVREQMQDPHCETIREQLADWQNEEN